MLGKNAFSGPATPSIFCRRCISRKLPNPGKPPILPPAKTKMYTVSQCKWGNPADIADLLWRRHIYNSAFLSMRRLFREEIGLKKSFTFGLEDIKKAEADELDTLLALNEARNKELALERDEREKVAMQLLEEETLKQIERRLDWEERNAEKRTKEVLAVIEKSDEFLTLENMEQKILDALETPTTFDYAIDLNGIKVENPVPDKYPHSVATLPNIFKNPLDYGPPIEGYKYKRGRPGHFKPKGPRNPSGNKGQDGGEGQKEAQTTKVVG
ncbi:hypothetical protein niasHT_017512 [Heterodera trifolii]|uniref:Small ribosomal subunit protein mS26 n=1 Tax=Heterodera trifolii TaxID=157864 RepID=A0ABD2L865_9BILA